MPKRFADSGMSDQLWYRKLPMEGKIFWRYLLDKCDAAGFWEKDYEIATLQNGFEVSDESLICINKDKLRVKDHGTHLEVVEFVSFQYGILKPDVKPHMPVIRLQKYYESKGYLKAIDRLKDKDMDKEKEKDTERGSVKGEKFIPPTIEEVRTYCLERRNGVDAQKLVDFYTSKGWKVGNQPMKDWRASVRTWEKRDGSAAPPKLCKICRKNVASEWVQVSGGIAHTECRDIPDNSRRLAEMKAKTLKTI